MSCRLGLFIAEDNNNPLKPWNESYMTDDTSFWGLRVRDWCEYIEGWPYSDRKSNVTWGTVFLAPPPDGTKDPFNVDPAYAPLNWDKAKEYFYSALTSTSKTDRETYFARTFKTVGHVMHLRQKISQLKYEEMV